MNRLIPCAVNKDDGKGNFVKVEHATLCDIGKEVAHTVTCHEPGFAVYHSNVVIVAMRGRNPEKPTDRTAGIPTEQRLEPNMDGLCNTLTTVQKDNLVMEKEIIIYDDYNSKVPPDQNHMGTLTTNCGTSALRNGYKIIEIKGNKRRNNMETVLIKQATKEGTIELAVGGVFDASFPSSATRRGRVQDGGTVSPTLTAQNNELYRYESEYRIRKLTPRECFRLMGVTDEDSQKMMDVNSNTQCYKQAGNSIVVDVMAAMFKRLF